MEIDIWKVRAQSYACIPKSIMLGSGAYSHESVDMIVPSVIVRQERRKNQKFVVKFLVFLYSRYTTTSVYAT